MSCFWKKNWIYFASAVGFLYQLATLMCMFANDIISAGDIRMWGGYFPWWTIFFTFTFWSNFFLLICYFLYMVWPKMQRNHMFLYICSCYIALVLIVVAFALFPAAVIAHNSVAMGRKTPPLSYAALIMPHGPGPVLFIIYSFLIFNFFPKGNNTIIRWKWGYGYLFLLIFFIPYMVMIIAINWIPIGAYVFNSYGKVTYLPGFSVYAMFTDLNPKLPYTSGHYGSPWRIIFFLLGILILTVTHAVYYAIIRMGIMKNVYVLPAKTLPIRQAFL